MSQDRNIRTFAEMLSHHYHLPTVRREVVPALKKMVTESVTVEEPYTEVSIVGPEEYDGIGGLSVSWLPLAGFSASWSVQIA